MTQMPVSEPTFPTPPATSVETLPVEAPPPAVVGIEEPTIQRYFDSLNAGDYEATGELFAVDGALQPPFEKPIVGPAAIVAYLQTEAKGFLLQPHQVAVQAIDDGNTEVQVAGKVHTPLFSVYVSWQFVLNPEHTIVLAKIKLLASLQELVKLRR